jgi:hypothetical protein
MPQQQPLRTSEQERDQVIATLSDHFSLGRLALDEFEQRVDQALRATTTAELTALLADLPVAQATSPVPTSVRPPAHRRTWAPSVVASAHPLSGGGWSSWWGTAVICLVIWLATSIASGSALYFWPFWVIVPWGVAMAARSFGPHQPCAAGKARLRRGSLV